MSRSDTLQIEHVIGPRLERRNERRNIVVETQTPSGKVALRLSASVAATLNRALTIALLAVDGPDLPEFFLSEMAPPPGQPRKRIRSLHSQWKRLTAA